MFAGVLAVTMQQVHTHTHAHTAGIETELSFKFQKWLRRIAFLLVLIDTDGCFRTGLQLVYWSARYTGPLVCC